MINKDVKTVRVGLIQEISENGKVKENLDRAMPHIKKSANEGARLVVLSEFYTIGYEFKYRILDLAETIDGPSVKWQIHMSKEFGIYLLMGFLEVDGYDFYNTCVLTTPTGEIAGKVRKQTPAVFEAFFADDSHIFGVERADYCCGLIPIRELDFRFSGFRLALEVE